MSTSAATLDHILDTLAALPLTSRRMFGEYAVYLEAKVVALICDDTLFIKPTPGAMDLLPCADQAPAYPGGKPWIVGSDVLDDPDLCQRVLRAVARDLPQPKPKTPRKAKVK